MLGGARGGCLRIGPHSGCWTRGSWDSSALVSALPRRPTSRGCCGGIGEARLRAPDREVTPQAAECVFFGDAGPAVCVVTRPGAGRAAGRVGSVRGAWSVVTVLGSMLRRRGAGQQGLW